MPPHGGRRPPDARGASARPVAKKPDKNIVERLLEQASARVHRAHKTGLSERASTALALPSLFASTGSLVLDRISAGKNPGGLPFGRVIHMPGKYSTGKTLILDHVLKSVIRMGGLGNVSEAEGSRDPHFAKAIGLDLNLLELQRPASLEELFDMGIEWHDAIRDQKDGERIPIVWGIDSLDASEALKASGPLTKSGGWHYGGGKSEALGAGLRKVVNRCARFPTLVFLLNQTREDPTVVYGEKDRPTGGNAPRFYCSLEVMLSLSPLGAVRGAYKGPPLTPLVRKRLGFNKTDSGDVMGRWVRAKISKTKIAPTFLQEADFYIDFQKGVAPWAGLLQRFIREGFVNAKENGEVTHRIEGGEIVDFPNSRAWVQWLSEHPQYLLTQMAPPEGEIPT